MQGWIEKKIETASWARSLISIATLLAYSFWIFRPSGRYQQAKQSVGTLPEEMFGFPDGEPAQAFSQLFGLQSDYILFQAIDIPYAILSFFAYTSIIALALKRFGFGATPMRFALLLPGISLVAEFIENTLLVILVRGGGETGSVVSLQQAMTSLKWASGFPSQILALMSLLALGILFLIKFIRGKTA